MISCEVSRRSVASVFPRQRKNITISTKGDMPMGADASEAPRAQAHHVTDPLIEVDLGTELAVLRTTDSYKAADHAAKTIVKQPGIRVVLIAPKAGGHMHEHHADWAITVQGVHGHAEVTVGETTVVLTLNRLLMIAAGMPHHVRGIDESAVLLTIGGAHSPS
jgi:quercetin dioxygenase-like cupin family protein